MAGTLRRTFSNSQSPPLRRAFLSYVVKDELGKGGFVFPSDFNFKNPEILLHLRRNFYKVLGGGKKEGVFAASLVDEAVQFGCRITVMIRKVNGFNQVEAEFAHGGIKFFRTADAGKGDGVGIGHFRPNRND